MAMLVCWMILCCYCLLFGFKYAFQLCSSAGIAHLCAVTEYVYFRLTYRDQMIHICVRKLGKLRFT